MEKALRIRLALFGERHPDVAQSYFDTGHMYREIGDDQKALEFMEKALKIRLAILGEGHPDVVDSYFDVGFEYGELGDDEGYKEVMEKVDQILGNKNS